MTPRIQKNLRQPPSPEPLRLTHAHAAGIDVHAAVHWVAVPPGDAPPPLPDHPANLPAHVRCFGACTADLIALADCWSLQAHPSAPTARGSSCGPTKGSPSSTGKVGAAR